MKMFSIRRIATLAIIILSCSTHLDAASISTNIILVDEFDVPITPTGPNEYTVQLGAQFKVRVQGTVHDPHFTDTNRPGTALDNQPLGIHIINGKVIAGGAGIVGAVPEGSGPVFQWSGFSEFIGLGNPPFVNVFDIDNDGDLDAAGAGVANTSRSMTGFLELFQKGVDGPDDLFEGYFSALGYGSAQVTYRLDSIDTAYVYTDPAGGTSGLDLENVLSTYSTTPITISVIPEPSAISIFAIAGVGLFWSQRRKHISD